MKLGPTILLKLALVVMTLVALILCVFAVPSIGEGLAIEFPQIASIRYPAMFGLWATSLPFFYVLYQAYRLLRYIDKNVAFSDLAVTALRKIKYGATTMFVMCILTLLPIFYIVAELDDAPGLILMGMVVVSIPFAVAGFAALLQKLLRNAIEIKSENELTV